MVDESKRLAGFEFAKKNKVPAWFVVHWKDSLGWVRWDVDLLGMMVGTGGRYDRGDPNDIDKEIYIPLGLFHMIEGGHGQDKTEAASRTSPAHGAKGSPSGRR